MMKSTKNLSFLVLGIAGFLIINIDLAQAIEIDLPGRTINTESSSGGSSAEIQYEGGATLEAKKTTTQSNTSVEVTKTAPVSAQAKSAVSVDIGTKKIQINSDSDLENYKKEVVSSCKVVKEINTDGDMIRVSYNQPARLFGIFRSNLNAKVEVDVNGEVDVKLPWYSFLYTNNSVDIQTKIESDMGVEFNDLSIGSQRKAIAIELVNAALSLQVEPCSSSTNANNNTETKATTSKPTSSKPTQTTSQTSTQTNTASNQTSVSASANVNVTLPVFKGEWNGTYSPNSLTSEDCKPGGQTSLTIDNNGGVVGYIVFRGEKGFGTGKVDTNGNLNGSWNYNGLAISFSGKISGNTGSGTYQNSLGCYGTFSISK